MWYHVPSRLAFMALRHKKWEHYKTLAPAMHLSYAFHAFVGAFNDQNEKTSFLAYMRNLFPWAVPDEFLTADPQKSTDDHYSAQVVLDVELAYELGYLAQDDLVFLGSAKLRASGAWPKQAR